MVFSYAIEAPEGHRKETGRVGWAMEDRWLEISRKKLEKWDGLWKTGGWRSVERNWKSGMGYGRQVAGDQ